MTELITGAKCSAHVTSAQQGAINAYTIGTDAYILDGCAATLPSANTLHIAAGHLMVQGRAIEVTATDLTIANGTQGTKRHDLACVHYAIANNVETASLAVVQGTASANPVDPTVSGSILAGDAIADIPLWRVSLDGITPTVAAIAPLVKNHVASIPAFYHGSDVFTSDSQGFFRLFEHADFVSRFDCEPQDASISVINGDLQAYSGNVQTSISTSADGHFVAVHIDNANSAFRANWTVVVFAVE